MDLFKFTIIIAIQRLYLHGFFNKQIPIRMKFLSYGVMSYMLLALIWWTVLLAKNNNEIYLKNIELHKLNPDLIIHPEQLQMALDKTKTHHDRIKLMIIGEGLVFGLSLVVGMWMIQNAHNKEVEQTRNQKNFLLSITHELKSPIASVQLITETLLKRKISHEEQADLLQSILSENKRLEKLINNLLLATKLEADYQFNFENIDINEVIKKCIQRQFIPNPNATITYEYDQPLWISGDKEALVSVFTNLIENGIKYGHSTPEIVITHKIIDKNLYVMVKDNGPGIAELEKDKIFNQFYRVGNEKTRKTKGTGLGLYITNKIIKAHKGKIKVDNDPYSGAIFSIILPIV